MLRAVAWSAAVRAVVAAARNAAVVSLALLEPDRRHLELASGFSVPTMVREFG